ncbi:PKD domain-containing protein [Streptomyces sp. NPDC059874]|uniref:PKD domain-containing protein n=1 Tax=Streptomyces sp. NPDC059874 TaxID=3346983 RepID=UPI003653D4BE
MRSSRVVVSAAALVAAGVVLIPGMAGIPGLAGAAHGAEPGTPAARGVSVPDIDPIEDAPFRSPADGAVRRTALSGANADLAVALVATATSAHGFGLDTEITSAAVPLTVTVEWGDGTKDVTTASGSGLLKHTHIYEELGAYTVKVTVEDTANATKTVNSVTVGTAGSDFTPYAPTRLLDTREGIGATQGPVPSRGTARVKVGGNGGIPQGVTAVVLNVTVTNPLGSGFITAYPEGSPRPGSSNVNFTAGQTVPNLVVVPVGENGFVDLYNGSWDSSVDVIADVTGYFTRKASSGYTSMDPVRFVDTREGLGTAQGQVPARGGFTTRIGGLRGVPSGISAVALNVTVTDPKASGYLTVLPGGGAIPNASNLNFTAGQTIANSVIVPVSADGTITVFNGSWGGATDVVVDVVGSYGTAGTGAYMPVEPERLFDTRDPAGQAYGALEGDTYIYAALSTRNPHITGYVLNSTVTDTKGAGYLTVAPDPNTLDEYVNRTAAWPRPPFISNLNWTAGATVPNLVQASTGSHGIIDFWNKGWDSTELVVDLFGYYDAR